MSSKELIEALKNNKYYDDPEDYEEYAPIAKELIGTYEHFGSEAVPKASLVLGKKYPELVQVLGIDSSVPSVPEVSPKNETAFDRIAERHNDQVSLVSLVSHKVDNIDTLIFITLTHGILNCERSALSHKAGREVTRIEYLRCEKNSLNEGGLDI